MGCVYQARNTVNGKLYVGKTIGNLQDRRSSHEDAARKGSQQYFHRALRKYGFDAFEWTELIEDEEDEFLCFMERRWIKQLGTLTPNGYNLMTGGEGAKHSEESKLKVSIGNKGKKRSEEFKRRVSEVHTGRKDTEETRLKRIASQRKMWENPTPEMIEQAKSRGRKTRGRKQSLEERAMRSAAQVGHPVSDETKAKLSASLKGNPKLKAASEANRAKRQEALRRWNRWREWESCCI